MRYTQLKNIIYYLLIEYQSPICAVYNIGMSTDFLRLYTYPEWRLIFSMHSVLTRYI